MLSGPLEAVVSFVGISSQSARRNGLILLKLPIILLTSISNIANSLIGDEGTHTGCNVYEAHIDQHFFVVDAGLLDLVAGFYIIYGYDDKVLGVPEDVVEFGGGGGAYF